MSTVPIEISTEQLLRAVERLPAAELDAFAARVAQLRSQRQAALLSADETALLLQINRAPLDAAQQARLDTLIARRQADALAVDELAELCRLIDLVEQRDGERLAALIALAQLRSVTLTTLMGSLGIPAPAYG